MTEGVLGLLGAMLLILFLMIVAPLIGGIVGWIFATVFDGSFAKLQLLLGVDFTGFEFGAVLGLIGAAFSHTTNK